MHQPPEVDQAGDIAPQAAPPPVDNPADDVHPPASAYTQAVDIVHSCEDDPKKLVQHIVPLIEIKEQLCQAANEVKQAVMLHFSDSVPKRHGQKSAIARAIHLSRNSIFPKPRSPKKATTRRQLAVHKVKAVDEFLRRADNGLVLPDKKYYKKDRGEFIGVVALIDTLRNLHRKFVTETGMSLSYSTFTKARDRRTVKTCRFLKKSVCLCTPHANMSYMLAAFPVLPDSTSQLCALSAEEITARLDKIDDDITVKYKRWHKDRLPFGAPERKKYVYHVELKKMSVTGEEFKATFNSDLPHFLAHSQRVHEQYSAVRKLKENLPADHAIIHMDYSENWSACYMREIQAAFYGKDQVTLHPMVVYTKEGEKLEHKCYVGVTSVTDHTFPTTLAFLMDLVNRMKDANPALKHIHMVTDSPTSQYRNRFACDMLSRAVSIFGVRITWNWLEAGHGKGPCDGVGGALKSLADRVVKKADAIVTADEFVDLVAPETEKVTLLKVTKSTIDELTSLVDSWLSRAVLDITQYHQATVFEDQLYVRPTSCYDECCFSEDQDLTPQCPSWRKAKLGPKVKPVTKPITEPTTSAAAVAETPAVNVDLEEEDEVDANEPGCFAQVFSSDDEVAEVVEPVHRKLRNRACDRVQEAKAALTKSTTTSKTKRKAAASVAAEFSECENDGDAEESDSDSDPDYSPETAEETAEKIRVRSSTRNIKTRRRRGEFVNEVIEDDGSALDDLPITWNLPIQTFKDHGYFG